tara:strand:+ start:165 stop:290 length:126 start_codon:yes stop_codon:yes gene_type:complete
MNKLVELVVYLREDINQAVETKMKLNLEILTQLEILVILVI